MSTITDSYEKHMNNNPDKIAIRTSSESINYREWYKLVCSTANWLSSFKVPAKTLGIFVPNGISFLQLFTGAAMAGWSAVTFDARWKPAELQQRLDLSSPSIFITTRALAHRVPAENLNIIYWEDVLEQIKMIETGWNRAVKEDTPFYMGFTSGTTGKPKAFIRSHHSWVASFACNRYDFHLDESDHVLIPGTLIHSHFLYGAVSTLFLGGTVYIMEKFSPMQALKIIETCPVTAVYVVPTMVEAMLKERAAINKYLKIISSGAKWEEHSKRKIPGMFPHLTMFEFYGASELSFVSFLCHDENKHNPGSVGKPFHNVEIEIRLPNGEKAKENEIGKIFVRSSMIISGYIHPGLQTVQTIRDDNGWATVDDMGYLDANGYLYIAGREKNMILYGGINIFPEEIETILTTHPGVEEAAVVGIQDTYWGQLPVAVIKGEATRRELQKLCMEKLSSFKVPRKWVYIKEMPHTLSGKIARVDVKKWAEAEVNINETSRHCQS